MSGYIGNIPTPQATQTRDTFTATSGQTSFATSGYTPGFLDVFLNGVHLVNGTDYTASNGSDVVLTSGATTGDNLEVVAYTTFQVVDQSFIGNFSVDSPTFVVDAANNRVGIGTSSPQGSLNVVKGTASGTTASTSANNIVIDGTSGTETGITLFSTVASTIRFGDASASGVGTIEYGHSTDYMRFVTAGAERLRITSTGSVGIGTSSPATLLDVRDGVGSILTLGNTGTFVGGESSYLKFREASTQLAEIGWEADTNELRINNRISAFTSFYTANTERARIDASGNLLVGKTSDDFGVAGFEARPEGAIRITRNGNPVAFFNRLTSDGDIVQFRKDGTTVGSIGSAGSGVRSYYAGNNVGISPYNGIIYPTDGSGSAADNAADLGASTHRFKNLYLSGGVYLGGTGSANLLDDYEEGAFTPELRASGGTNPTVNYSVQSGFYIKIGRYVFVSINLNWTSQSGGTGLVRVGNLPITPSANSNIRALGSIPYIDCFTGLTNAYGMAVHTSFPADTNGPYFYYHGSDGDIAAYVNIANVASSGALQVCLGYYSV
jgi:hypothetical protein